MNRTARFIHGQFFLGFVFFAPVIASTSRSFVEFRSTKIAEIKNYSTDKQRDIFNSFETEDKNDQGFPIDPFDLMNRLKQVESMNDATTPSDALDEALSSFDESEY